MSEIVTVIKEPEFMYLDYLGRSAWLKIEKVISRDLVDGYREREMIWHRYSYAESATGDEFGNWDILFNIPYGLSAK